ncbi:MAG: Zn-ribbon domain-containing OB-fold protein [Pseudomonadota bacterium]
MGFEQFGIISFTATTKTEKFIEFLSNNEIRGTVCSDCGAKFFPPRSDCSACFSNKMEWFPISGEGSLVSFTKAMFAPAGFEKDVPYTLGVAEFADGVKVFARISNAVPEDKVAAGMKVTVRSVDLGEGRLSFEFISA